MPWNPARTRPKPFVLLAEPTTAGWGKTEDLGVFASLTEVVGSKFVGKISSVATKRFIYLSASPLIGGFQPSGSLAVQLLGV